MKKEVEDKITALKGVLDTGTKEDLETKTKDLSDSLQKVGQAMYQQPGQPGPESTANGEQKAKEDKSDSAKATPDKEEPVEGEVVN